MEAISFSEYEVWKDNEEPSSRTEESFFDSIVPSNPIPSHDSITISSEDCTEEIVTEYGRPHFLMKQQRVSSDDEEADDDGNPADMFLEEEESCRGSALDIPESEVWELDDETSGWTEESYISSVLP